MMIISLSECVSQTGDLLAVHRGVKFSCHFTLTEITERWHALLKQQVLFGKTWRSNSSSRLEFLQVDLVFFI